MKLATKRESFRRKVNLSFIVDRAHYDEVILGAVARARVSVWIGTANVKELHIEATPGTRARARGAYVSILQTFEALADKGVELRILHGALPSRPFREELARRTNPIATSADGARAAFFAGTNLMVENLDGTSPIEIGKLCSKALAFDGRGDLVSTDCPAPVGSISAFAAPTLARSFVAAETGYTIDPTGSWVWVVDDDAGGELVQASDGTIAFSDVLATGAAFFDPAGTRLFYVSGDALKSVSIASPGSATTIAASGVESILALSPDGNHLVYKGLTGAFLQATTPGGLAVKLDERIEPAALRGVPTPDMPGKIPTVTYSFTSDSSDVVALTGPIQAGGVPSYRVRPVARNEVLAEGAAESISALAGSKLLVVGPGEDGRVIDVSGASATIDVPGMGAFALSKDRTQIAYVTSEGTEPGLYVVSTSGSGLH